MEGKLYLCATPIGNLEDITLRTLKVLEEVDIIAAEDTRNSMKLLNHYSIKTPMTSYHEHNKYDKAKYLVSRIKQGENIALITDAGTPAVSDPGEELVKACYDAGIEVSSLPGASAVITALTLSGLSTRRFIFEGFLPSKKKEQKAVLEAIKNETRTIIFYEAPHKLVRTLEVLLEHLGNRKVSVIKELTKRFETVFRTTLSEAAEYFGQNDPRGEYVIVLEGKDQAEIYKEEQEAWEQMSLEEHVALYEKQGMERKEAMRQAAKDRKISKRDVYNALMR